MRNRLTLCGLTILIAAVILADRTAAADLVTALRRPVAMAQSNDGNLLYVANRDSGSISVIDLDSRKVVAEKTVGQRLSALIALPDSNRLLAADEATHKLLVINASAGELHVSQELAVSPYPVSLCLLDDGKRVSIASLWSRRVMLVVFANNGEASISQVLNLPFAPRAQLLLPEHDKLLVADSFSGRLALIKATTGELNDLREFPGHNIRGLGVSADGKMLLVAHQMLNELAHSIRNDIHWGLLMSNDLRWLQIDSVLAGGKQLYQGAHMHPLGEAGRGGGDPGGLAVAPDGTVCVAISGVNEVAIGKEGDFSMHRVPVGRRPTAVTISKDGHTAFVANTLDDSISVIALAERKVTATIPLGPTPPLSLAQRGELLFYDATISHDGWMSCHSCHTDGHANGQMNDNFSDRSFGAPKRVLSLLGVRDTFPLAWNGQIQTLERQIDNSVEKTMQREDPLPREDVKAIAAYVKTLEPPPPLDELRGTQDTAAAERGRQVFAKHDCAQCHAAPAYTSPEAYDVGLKDSQGNTEFNPPSLRGLSHRAPFLHDNRAATLEEVFLKHGHPSDTTFTADEVKDLTAFLLGL